MAFVLLGGLSVAILAGCVAFIIYRLTGLFARWMIPVSAGIGMLGFTVWNDYTWFGRLQADLPPDVIVADTFTATSPMQPWTLLIAPVNRFRAVDRTTIDRLATAPDLRRAAVFMVARFTPTFVTPQVFDCAGHARADGTPNQVDADGVPPSNAWVPLAPDDPLLRAVCDAPLG